jgi:hypothetical protein
VGAYNIIFVMPKLRDLLTRENDRDALCIADAAGVEHEMKRLKIFVAEKERALTDPSVIINIVRSMNELYDALSSLYGANGVSLAVGAIDSGGGKSFDFFGAVHVMEALDDLFISVWNRIKLSGEENIRYLIEMAMMASGFMAKIKEAQIGQIVSEDQAQRLTRLVAKAVETLFRNGAYTETMDEVRVIRASEFLTPKTQLLEYKQEARVEPKREDARDYADPLAGSSGAGLFASPVLGAASALNGGGYSDGGLGGSGLGGSGLGGSGLGGSSLGDSSLGGSGLNGGGLNGSAGGLYGASAYGASASPTPARSNGPAAEPLYRPQPTVLRDFREQRDPVKDLKDILEAS